MANDIMQISIGELTELSQKLKNGSDEVNNSLNNISQNIDTLEDGNLLAGEYARAARSASEVINNVKIKLNDIVTEYIKVLTALIERRSQLDKDQANKLNQNNDQMNGKGSGSGGGGGGQQKPKEENKDKNKAQTTNPYDYNKANSDYKPNDNSLSKTNTPSTINNENERPAGSSAPAGSGSGGSQPAETGQAPAPAPAPVSGQGLEEPQASLEDVEDIPSEEVDEPIYEDMAAFEPQETTYEENLPDFDEGTTPDEMFTTDISPEDVSTPIQAVNEDSHNSTLTKASIGGMLLGSGAVAAGLSRKRNEDEDGETMSYTEEQEWSDLDNLSNIYDNQDVNNVSW